MRTVLRVSGLKMPKLMRAPGSRSHSAEQLPLRLRSHGSPAPVLAGWLARQDWSVPLLPRFSATSKLTVLLAGDGAALEALLSLDFVDTWLTDECLRLTRLNLDAER